MIRHRLRALLIAGAAAFTITAIASGPARAQWIVFDPTNYAQNILTAARELQQVNNEIQMLENQATSLINQARNLASLPYSSLTQLQQPFIWQCQILAQARGIDDGDPLRSEHLFRQKVALVQMLHRHVGDHQWHGGVTAYCAVHVPSSLRSRQRPIRRFERS